MPINAFSQHYKNLWTDANYDQKEWSSYTYDNDAITLDELEETIKNLKNGKAPGDNNVSSEFYKYVSVNFKLRLVNFLNNIYANGTIPRRWNNATAVPIFKKGDKKDPKNYRGISLLNACYKIYAKILNGKLKT
jgi:hypothetical protein